MTLTESGIPAAINGHRIAGLIGAGGQSRVFALDDTAAGRPLALKWSHEKYTPPWTDPLVEEYRTLSTLHHPQLTQPYEFGYADGRAYMVIDRVDGPTLYEGLTVPGLESMWRLLIAVCPVLSFIHRRGLVHRDLKPDNFRWSAPADHKGSISEYSLLYLLDLGLASRPRNPATEGRAGTLYYMAPEVLKEGKLDARSDLYSLGVILYEWLCGVPPFPGPEPADIIDGHLSRSVHWPESVSTTIDTRILAYINIMLAKNPDERPESVEKVIAGFAQVGLPVEDNFPESQNLPWHLQSTAALYPAVGFPVDPHVAFGRPASIAIAGDPGAGIPNILARWKRELAFYGWSIDGDKDGFTARRPDDAKSTIIVGVGSASNDPVLPGESNPAGHMQVVHPLDTTGVTEYLKSVFFDNECVEALSPPAAQLSSGLPEALDIVLSEWVGNGVVSYQHGRWQIDHQRLGDAATNPRLRELYGYAVEKLTTPQRRCLGFAAIFGTKFSTELLGRLLTDDGIPTETINELFACGIFIEDHDATEPMINGRFRLSGLADVWAADLPPEHVRNVHKTIAAALDDVHEMWGPLVHRRLTHHRSAAGQHREAFTAAITWAEHSATAEGAEEAHHYLDLADTAARAYDPDPTKSDALARIALVRGRTFKASGIHENAQACFRRVFAITRKTGNIRLHAAAAKHLGDSYKATRQHLKGWRILKIALKNFERLNDEIEISHTLNNLGNVAYYRQDINLALEYYLKALTIQRAHDLTAVMASTLSNIGSVYIQKADFQQGQHYMKESLRIKETLNQPGEVARTLNNLGSVNVIIGEYATAEEYLYRAATINKSIGAGDEWLINWVNIFDAWFMQAEYRKAIDNAPQIFDRCDELDDDVYRIYFHIHLARCFFRIGDYRACRGHLEKVKMQLGNVADSSLIARYFVLQAELRLLFNDKEGCRRALTAALEHAGRTGDPRERAEVYLAAAAAEKTVGEISPELFAPAEEAHRLFEQNSGRHRLFELLLITAGGSLDEFLAEFPLPEDISKTTNSHYAGPVAYRGLWLWRVAQKAAAEAHVEVAERLLCSLAEWGTAHETAELTWRAHTELGILYHAAHDYELAARSFGAAFTTLQKTAQTIDDGADRKAYLAHEDVARLSRHMQTFSARFAAKK